MMKNTTPTRARARPNPYDNETLEVLHDRGARFVLCEGDNGPEPKKPL